MAPTISPGSLPLLRLYNPVLVVREPIMHSPLTYFRHDRSPRLSVLELIYQIRERRVQLAPGLEYLKHVVVMTSVTERSMLIQIHGEAAQRNASCTSRLHEVCELRCEVFSCCAVNVESLRVVSYVDVLTR